MLYAVQLEDGGDSVAAIVSARDDAEAAVRAEQWRDSQEWEPANVWKKIRIWKLGEQVSHEIKIERGKKFEKTPALAGL